MHPWASCFIYLQPISPENRTPERKSGRGHRGPRGPTYLHAAGEEASPCCPSEDISWPPAPGREPGVLMAILVALWDHKVFPSFLGTWRKNQGFRGLHLRLTAQGTSPKTLGTCPPCSAHLTSRSATSAGSATSADSASSLGSFCLGLKAERGTLWDPSSPN